MFPGVAVTLEIPPCEAALIAAHCAASIMPAMPSATPAPALRWDLFCRVIDNYGDIGVSWRLARVLREEPSAGKRKILVAIDDVTEARREGKALEAAKSNEDLLKIKAYQYDIVCNGVELSSGAIRNHRPEIMYKAFEIAGYSKEDVDTNFAGMINAFKFGAPPHGGSAPGIDRIVMLLADEPNIREVIVFPMNQKAEDLMMGAPGPVTAKQLRELNIRIVEQTKG